MKRVLFLSLIVLLAASCKTSFERTMVREVTKDIKDDLKKPESLQDLVITYAIPTQDEIDAAFDKDDYDYPQIKGEEGTCIVCAKYKARNSYNDLVDGYKAYHYIGSDDGRVCYKLELKNYELHMFVAMLNSKNKKELK